MALRLTSLSAASTVLDRARYDLPRITPGKACVPSDSKRTHANLASTSEQDGASHRVRATADRDRERRQYVSTLHDGFRQLGQFKVEPKLMPLHHVIGCYVHFDGKTAVGAASERHRQARFPQSPIALLHWKLPST